MKSRVETNEGFGDGSRVLRWKSRYAGDGGDMVGEAKAFQTENI